MAEQDRRIFVYTCPVCRTEVRATSTKDLEEHNAADLAAALAARFTPTELALIAPYLTRRAVEARATSRADEAAALRRLGDAVAAAGNVQERDDQ